MTALPYVIVVSDGVSIRTLHPPALGRHRAVIDAAIASMIAGDFGDAPRAPAPAREGEILPHIAPVPRVPRYPDANPTISPTMTQGRNRGRVRLHRQRLPVLRRVRDGPNRHVRDLPELRRDVGRVRS